MTNEEINRLIDIEVTKQIAQMTWAEFKSVIETLSDKEKRVFIDNAKKQIYTNAVSFYKPAATTKINNFVNANSFPASFVSKII